ncbi:MAG: hypothetical protein QXQ57_00675 [Sulfolobales archaeon]
MPLDPKDFLKLSEQLYADQRYYHIKEAVLRTAISRTYYATFLTMRELVRSKLVNTPLLNQFERVSTSGLTHSLIKSVISRVDIHLGNMYGKLFVMRKKADYELNITIKDRDVEEVLEIAKKLLNLSTKIYGSLKVAEISSIIMEYYQKLRKS